MALKWAAQVIESSAHARGSVFEGVRVFFRASWEYEVSSVSGEEKFAVAQSDRGVDISRPWLMSQITRSDVVHAEPVVNSPLCIVFQPPREVVKWRTIHQVEETLVEQPLT
jgi:hypothetical protein